VDVVALLRIGRPPHGSQEPSLRHDATRIGEEDAEQLELAGSEADRHVADVDGPGERVEDHLARCPRTAAALEAAPRVDIPGRGPTAFFSILEPRTTIPAHHGVTNTRLIVHLPLVVPPGCRFRVGSDTREWQTGEAWVFDDTIEHEAVNDSDAPRAILIFDIWHPELTMLERELIREATAALGEYYGPEGLPDVNV